MSRDRATRVQLGQHAIYSQGLPAQGGGGRLDTAVQGLQKANTFAKKNKVVTKGAAVVDALGLTPMLNKKTGGVYGDAVSYAKSKGYGKKKKGGGRRKK